MLNQPSGDAMPQPRILIVDDEDDILNGYASVLGRTESGTTEDAENDRLFAALTTELFDDSPTATSFPQFDLCLCHQAVEALQAVNKALHEQQPFAVAFIDIRLPPGPDGIALAECLHALDPLINIIIVTGYSDIRLEEITKRISSPDKLLYCQKPLHASELIQLANSMSAKWETERQLMVTKKKMDHLLSATKVVLYSCSISGHGQITYVSDNVQAVFGYQPENYIANADFIRTHTHPDDVSERQQALIELKSGAGHVAAIYRFRTATGDYRWVSDQVRVIRDGNEQPTEQVGCWIDITDRRHDEERIRYLAYHDNLTGLPNRVLMRDMLDQALAMAARYQRTVAVLYLDLDHFKKVNDSLGHACGDLLLKEAARRIISVVRSTEMVCRQVSDGLGEEPDRMVVSRLGGDEFVVILSDIRCPVDAAVVARRIRGVLSIPFHISPCQDDIIISTSIGISLSPDDGHDAETLLKCADNAMYMSKDSGRNMTSFFTRSLGDRADRRLSLESKLQRSLENGDFTLSYQPKISLVDGSLVGVEALLRWHHPDMGDVLPAEFIPIAEASGLIVPLGDWVITEAVHQAMVWQQTGRPPLVIAVNVSAVQFRHPDLIDRIDTILSKIGLPHQYLSLELTESLLIDDSDMSVRRLNRLGELGVQLSIDDFGTGYSSLSYLQKFPLKELKIDQSFIRDIPNHHNNAAIVRATIALGHELGVRVVAEGVENNEQLRFLRELRCDEVQGYYISPPLPAPAFDKWSREHESFSIHHYSRKPPILHLVS